MSSALARHDALLRQAIEAEGGYVFKTMGDAFCAAFPTAPQALQAAIQAQRALHTDDWNSKFKTQNSALRVRAALHTGMTEERDGDYFGTPVNRVARLLSAGHGGQTLLSLSTHELVRDHLPGGVELRDMGEHRLKDLGRPERVFQLIASGLPTDFPPLRSLDNLPNNLPLERSPLIGREKEAAAIAKIALRTDAGVVTLTGPGGTGKTRLALQVAADLLDEFKDGVFFVNLAAITDPSLVASEIAQALGIRESGGRPLVESLKDYLRDKRMLLLLDNFEQVIAAAPLVTDLLGSAAGLKVMVTSRMSLRLRGEKEYLVPPLSLPDPKQLPSLEQLTQYETVRLFIERATNAKPDFTVTNENAPAVAEICHRLDGLPLAIELAAARIKILPPHAMLARLQNRLKVLTGGNRDLPARQQTLRGAIEWSHDLLDEEEKKLFRRLAVFAGGRNLEAIEAVCSADGDLGIDVLDGVSSLVDKSLLRQEEGVGEEPRFVMLETIHEFAREKLEESGEAGEMQRRHALYFLASAEEAEPKLQGSDQGVWFSGLEEEQDNIRAVFVWCQREESGVEGAEIGLRLAGALARYWYTRGPYVEGRQRAEGVLARAEAKERTAWRARALRTAGMLAWVQGDFASAQSLDEECLEIAREVGDRQLQAYMLNNLGLTAREAERDLASARSLFEQSLAIHRELGNKYYTVIVLCNLGGIDQLEGDFASARARHEEAMAIARELGDKTSIAHSLQWLGQLAYLEGDYPLARSLLEQGIAMRREMGDKWSIPWSLINLGYTTLREGDYDGAAAIFRQSLTFGLEEGIERFILPSISGLAGVAGVQGEAERAARLFGATEALQEISGFREFPYHSQADVDRNIVAARAQLDGETWQSAWEEGQAMSMEQAVAYALEETEQPREDGKTSNG